jgi:heptosyltransferase-2
MDEPSSPLWPESSRLWIRLPNWLGDVVMALPIIRAIVKSRPDLEINMVGQAHFMPLLEKLGVGDVPRPLPKKGTRGYYRHFRQFRKERPDRYLLFTNSLRGDLEAWMTGCRQRIGMARPGKFRPLLSDKWQVPRELDEDQVHQTRVWEQMLRHFGLRKPLDFTPIRLPESDTTPPPSNRTPVLGLICGTENDPSKRWPVARWRELISMAHTRWPEARFQLFGTARDTDITRRVAADAGPHVEDLAGKTNLVEFATALGRCTLIVCNDTGGMHIANALGVPVAGIFGPSNPLRTGPIFDAPVAILQATGCPKSGGTAIAGIRVDPVLKSVSAVLQTGGLLHTGGQAI